MRLIALLAVWWGYGLMRFVFEFDQRSEANQAVGVLTHAAIGIWLVAVWRSRRQHPGPPSAETTQQAIERLERELGIGQDER